MNDVLVRRPDVDVADRTVLLGTPDAVRPTVHSQHNLAGHVQPAVVAGYGPVGEDHRAGLRLLEWYEHQFGLDAARRCPRAEGARPHRNLLAHASALVQQGQLTRSR